MKVLKVIFNTRVISAVVSAVSAVICACLAGCKLYVGELAMKDVSSEILSVYCTTNNVKGN